MLLLMVTSFYTLTMNRPQISGESVEKIEMIETVQVEPDEHYKDIILNKLKKVEKTDKDIPITKHTNDEIKYAGATTPRQVEVVNAFRHAWKAYEKYAWGKDILKPISKSYETWFNLGMTILDSVDGLYIMGLQQEYKKARNWIADMTFDKSNSNINLFECTIRILGSLLSMFSLSGDEMYKIKAIELGERLLPAFDSPSKGKVPYSDVNLALKSGNQAANMVSTSEATTIQLEFIELSRISGSSKYREAVEKITKHVHDAPDKISGALVGRYMSPYTGEFNYDEITLGSRSDSYYEYLLKMWVQSGYRNNQVKDDYIEAIHAIDTTLKKRSFPNSLTYVGELIGGSFVPKMDHLVCFLPGTLALGAHLKVSSSEEVNKKHMQFAVELLDTCIQMYMTTPTKLAPEIAHFSMGETAEHDIHIKPADRHNLLRPETVESLLYMYRITKNETYRDVGYTIFQAFEKYTKMKEGYSSIKNVNSVVNPSPMDKMETFFLGETLKYFYLLFSDDESLLPFSEWVFNTEAHPLPIVNPSRRSNRT